MIIYSSSPVTDAERIEVMYLFKQIAEFGHRMRERRAAKEKNQATAVVAAIPEYVTKDAADQV